MARGPSLRTPVSCDFFQMRRQYQEFYWDLRNTLLRAGPRGIQPDLPFRCGAELFAWRFRSCSSPEKLPPLDGWCWILYQSRCCSQSRSRCPCRDQISWSRWNECLTEDWCTQNTFQSQICRLRISLLNFALPIIFDSRCRSIGSYLAKGQKIFLGSILAVNCLYFCLRSWSLIFSKLSRFRLISWLSISIVFSILSPTILLGCERERLIGP